MKTSTTLSRAARNPRMPKVNRAVAAALMAEEKLELVREKSRLMREIKTGQDRIDVINTRLDQIKQGEDILGIRT